MPRDDSRQPSRPEAAQPPPATPAPASHRLAWWSRLPFVGALDAAQRRRRARGKALLQEARILQRRARGRLSAEVTASLEAASMQVRNGRSMADGAGLEQANTRLENLLARHLAPYQRPSWLENIESMGYAVLVALILRALVVEAFKIPSGSMIPTLAIGDQIFVNKYIYGPRVPFTNFRPLHFAQPKRGEVVVFVCPMEPHEDFIKRIVGLAGDEVMVRRGRVYINGEPIARAPLGEVVHWDKDNLGARWLSFRAHAFAEELGEHKFVALEDADMGHRAADFGPHTVPEGHVFMMGDNRDHSYDSRAWGPVPIDNILGKSMFVWWSWGQDGLRRSRLGTWLE